MPIRQMTAQAIYQLLYITGDKLLLVYKKAFLAVRKDIKQRWVPQLEKYLDDRNGMIKEVQNEPEFVEGEVSKESAGLDLVKHYVRRLNERVDEHNKQANDPTFTGTGRFKDHPF